MCYKMIVLDLDDTLLNDDLTISCRNNAVLEKVQEAGIVVVLASGRPTFAMEKYARELKLDVYGGYIISYNGAVMKDCKRDKIIFQRAVPQQYAHELYALSKEHNVFIHTYIGDDIITACMNEYTGVEENLTGMRTLVVDDFIKAVDRDVIKVLMLEEPTYLKSVAEIIKQEIGDKMNITISKPFFLEFMDKGINKSFTLKMLSQQIGIEASEIIAMGDSYNDLEMIKFAGLGIAMENAPEDVKKEADYVTDSNMGDGVAKAIEGFVLSGVTI